MKQEELYIVELQKLGLKSVKIERNGGKRKLFLLFSNGNKVKMFRCGKGICVSSKETIEVRALPFAFKEDAEPAKKKSSKDVPASNVADEDIEA